MDQWKYLSVRDDEKQKGSLILHTGICVALFSREIVVAVLGRQQ